MHVNKERFDEFIKNYPNELALHDIEFTTPSSTIYCDFSLHPEMNPGLERIQACLVAEHVNSCPYYGIKEDEYYINDKFVK